MHFVLHTANTKHCFSFLMHKGKALCQNFFIDFVYHICLEMVCLSVFWSVYSLSKILTDLLVTRLSQNDVSVFVLDCVSHQFANCLFVCLFACFRAVLALQLPDDCLHNFYVICNYLRLNVQSMIIEQFDHLGQQVLRVFGIYFVVCVCVFLSFFVSVCVSVYVCERSFVFVLVCCWYIFLCIQIYKHNSTLQLNVCHKCKIWCLVLY